MKRIIGWIGLVLSSIGSLGVVMMLITGDEKPNVLVAIFWFGLLFVSVMFINNGKSKSKEQ